MALSDKSCQWISSMKSVRKLNVSCNRDITEAQMLLENLESFEAYGCSISALVAKDLRILNLSYNPVQDLTLGTNLQELMLAGALDNLPSTFSDKFLELPNLQKLDLSDNLIFFENSTEKIFDLLRKLSVTNIKSLYLNNNFHHKKASSASNDELSISTRDDEDYPEPAIFENLLHLDLSGSCSGKNLIKMTECFKFKSLVSLFVNDN